MNLSGNWKGEYKYGKDYPEQFRGKSVPFEFELIDNDGAITGTCIDDIVEEIEGNECHLTGTFNQGHISFKKRYKYAMALNEDGTLLPDDKIESDGVDYTGRHCNNFLTREKYFKGTWSITGVFLDEDNLSYPFKCTGRWKMSRK